VERHVPLNPLRRLLQAAPREVLFTGIPRSGTTLCCHLLNKLPDVLALHEPMDLRPFFDTSDPHAVRRLTGRFLDATRRSVLRDGVARSKNVGGRVPSNPVSDELDENGERRRVTSKGEIVVDRALAADFLLVVKQPGLFTAFLDTLAPRFRIVAIVRNPLAILSSWNSVPFRLREGRTPATERLVPALARALDGTADVLTRQLLILDWYFDRYARLIGPENVLRYEDLIATRGRILGAVVPSALGLDEPLRSRNDNELYSRERMREVGARLLGEDGAWRKLYAPHDVEALLESAAPQQSPCA
jgi:hypothetical protein